MPSKIFVRRASRQWRSTREVGGVPGAAVDLQSLARDAFGHLAGEQLEHRRLVVDRDAGVGVGCHLVHERAARLDLGRHLGDLEPQRLEVADRPIELPALLAVGDRVLERAARQPMARAPVCTRASVSVRDTPRNPSVSSGRASSRSKRLSADTRRPSIDSSHVCQPKYPILRIGVPTTPGGNVPRSLGT